MIQRALAANHDIGIAAVRLEEAKAMLGGGWELCAQANQHYSAADGMSNVRFVK